MALEIPRRQLALKDKLKSKHENPESIAGYRRRYQS